MLKKICGVLSDIRIVKRSAQASMLSAELSRQEGSLRAEHSAQESILRAELLAEASTLRDKLAAAHKRFHDLHQGPRCELRQSCNPVISRILHRPSATAPSLYPGIFAPTVVKRTTVKKAAGKDNTSTQTLQVIPTYVHTATNTNSKIGAVSNPVCSFSVLTAVQIQPQPQQSIKSNSSALSFSSITAIQIQPRRQQPALTNNVSLSSSVQAVHTIEPVPYKPPAIQSTDAPLSFSSVEAVYMIEPVPYKRPGMQTTDVGIQANIAEDVVFRDELRAREKCHTSEVANLISLHLTEITALKSSTEEHFAEQKKHHDTVIANLKSSHAFELEDLKAQHFAEFKALKTQQAANFETIHTKYAGEIKARDDQHATVVACLKTSYANEIAARDASRSNDSSALSTIQSQLTLYKEDCMNKQVAMNNASAHYAAMEARVESKNNENSRLKAELQAANEKVAAGASQQEVEEYVQKIRSECVHEVAVKDKDCERKLHAVTERLLRSEADRKKAEMDAKAVPGLRQQNAILEMQVNKRKLPGVAMPGDGSRKNAAKLQEELKQAEKDRDECWHFWKRDSEQMKVFDREKSAAMAEVGKLERANARYREALGPGARTIVAEKSVNAVAGKKRGAEEG